MRDGKIVSHLIESLIKVSEDEAGNVSIFGNSGLNLVSNFV